MIFACALTGRLPAQFCMVPAIEAVPTVAVRSLLYAALSSTFDRSSFSVAGLSATPPVLVAVMV